MIGICYGAQLAAHALGGSVARAADHEIGWYYVESHDPALCPPGPWVQYHYDTFTVPDGARLLGHSDVGPQGFAVETAAGRLRLVAWQFHPEVDAGILRRWVAEDAQALPRVGVDAAAFVAETEQRGPGLAGRHARPRRRHPRRHGPGRGGRLAGEPVRTVARRRPGATTYFWGRMAG